MTYIGNDSNNKSINGIVFDRFTDIESQKVNDTMHTSRANSHVFMPT